MVFLGIILILSSWILISSIITWRKNFIIKKQIKKLNNGIVSIKTLPDSIYYDDDDWLYLTNSKHIYTLINPFAIITKNSAQPKIYTLTIPFLNYSKYNSSVELHYNSTRYRLNDLSNVKSVIKHRIKNNYKLSTAHKLAPIIQEHLQIKAEIKELNQQDVKISNLAQLVATSDIYNERLHTYATTLLKIRNCLKQAKQLDQSYTRLVREMLIGIKVAEEELKHLPDRETSFDLQYQRIQEEYNFMKDEATAYYQLLKDSRYIQV